MDGTLRYAIRDTFSPTTFILESVLMMTADFGV